MQVVLSRGLPRSKPFGRDLHWGVNLSSLRPGTGRRRVGPIAFAFNANPTTFLCRSVSSSTYALVLRDLGGRGASHAWIWFPTTVAGLCLAVFVASSKRRFFEGQVVLSSEQTHVKAPVMRLSNGVELPLIGFGTGFGLRSPETAWAALPKALDAGYGHIDAAAMYGNERHVGDVLGHYFMSGKLGRDDVFVSTKVAHPPFPSVLPEPSRWQTAHMQDACLDSHAGLKAQFCHCLDRLGLGSVDLLLIHWPGPRPGNYDEKEYDAAAHNRRKRREMWKAMEDIYERKLARAIGVSNFTQRHLEELLADGVRVVPHVNQIEVHPYCSQASLLKFCQNKGIAVVAFSPLARGRGGLLQDDVVVSIAAERGWTSGQVVLRWLLQKGCGVIPKSTSPARLRENLAVGHLPELSAQDMLRLDALNRDALSYTNPESIP